MKSRIFITAGQRPAEKQTLQIRLKDGTYRYAQIQQSPAFQAVLSVLARRRSLTCGYENHALRAKTQKLFNA
ncbi:MAG: hypothetical protein LBE82_01460 [Chitinophagaceae bacterium]|nr:hypothetical protein [Chitinophagaceae bacterium]